MTPRTGCRVGLRSPISFNIIKKVKMAFNELRNIFTIDTVIVYFNLNKKTVVETDVLDYINEKVLF